MRKRISSRRGVNRNPSKITKRVKMTRIRIKQANAYEMQVFRLVNEERTSRGIAALTLNSMLTDLAVLKSRDMRDKNYFSHRSPTYGTPEEMLNRYGVKWQEQQQVNIERIGHNCLFRSLEQCK